MINKVLCFLAVVMLSGCSNDWSAGLASHRADKPSSTTSLQGAPAVPALPAPVSAGSFADAPDKGSLVEYPKDPVVRRSGAYTWHAADLSEDHALRSTISGRLRFTAPDGTPVDLAYERHVEHPDGNWSWIGRAVGGRGESTVITFGEEAVFGTIPQGRDKPPLRLTISDGRAWVVSSDPRLLREIRNEATHPTKPDFLVPPKLVSTAGSTASGMEAMGAQAVGATTSGNKIMVDLVMGFTDGYSAYRGGTSAAVTRIHNLVEVTNQAYRNSQVNAELRLVHAMQVSYPDATDNKTALEELTGFRAPSTKTTPAPAFSALRSARDQYGADVVVLLRRFQDPENDGCGIAWLIGGNRSGIDASDEFFGYSVVGDGQDAGTDGKTYFCRDETLAHEIGHNMGSQHDAENARKADGSTSYGAYSYSFGHKTAVGGGNFYTVMAYGDSGQVRNRVFSSPTVAICGVDENLACGVADQADNARSLNQTSSIVASFRATVVPIVVQRKVADDFNGDGVSDILWRNFSTGANAIWLSAASSTTQPILGINNFAWTIVGTGDFNGDGPSDVLWRNTSTGANAVWLSANKATQIPMTTIPNQSWTVVGVGDFDGDGLSDILWRNVASGANSIWRSGNYALTQAVTQVADLRWTVVGVGDFNGDGRSDILWRHASTGGNAVWYSADYATRTNLATISDLRWKVVGVGDFDGDGRSDILWRHDGTGSNAIWRSANKATALTLTRISNLDWTVVDVADYNGDGQSDVLWRNVSSGSNSIWRSGNYGDPQAVTRVSNLAWRVVGD